MLHHEEDTTVTVTLQADLCGDGRWTSIRPILLRPRQPFTMVFPRGWSCYWLRFVADRDCTATATLIYD